MIRLMLPGRGKTCKEDGPHVNSSASAVCMNSWHWLQPCCWGIWGMYAPGEEYQLLEADSKRPFAVEEGEGKERRNNPTFKTPSGWKKHWREKIEKWGCARNPHVVFEESDYYPAWVYDLSSHGEEPREVDEVLRRGITGWNYSNIGQAPGSRLTYVRLGARTPQCTDISDWCACIKLWRFLPYENGIVKRKPDDDRYYDSDFVTFVANSRIEKLRERIAKQVSTRRFPRITDVNRWSGIRLPMVILP